MNLNHEIEGKTRTCNKKFYIFLTTLSLFHILVNLLNTYAMNKSREEHLHNKRVVD